MMVRVARGQAPSDRAALKSTPECDFGLVFGVELADFRVHSRFRGIHRGGRCLRSEGTAEVGGDYITGPRSVNRLFCIAVPHELPLCP